MRSVAFAGNAEVGIDPSLRTGPPSLRKPKWADEGRGKAVSTKDMELLQAVLEVALAVISLYLALR